MRWIVDGMNVIGSRPDGWWRDRHAAMVHLVDRLERWAAADGEDVVVVFEQPPRPPIARASSRSPTPSARGRTPPTTRSCAASSSSPTRARCASSPPTACSASRSTPPAPASIRRPPFATRSTHPDGDRRARHAAVHAARAPRPRLGSNADRALDTSTGGHRPQLDGIRAVAVILVIAFHLGYALDPRRLHRRRRVLRPLGLPHHGAARRRARARAAASTSRASTRAASAGCCPPRCSCSPSSCIATLGLLDRVDHAAVGDDATSAALYGANWHFGLAERRLLRARRRAEPARPLLVARRRGAVLRRVAGAAARPVGARARRRGRARCADEPAARRRARADRRLRRRCRCCSRRAR